jgi:hypothetical protein
MIIFVEQGYRPNFIFSIPVLFVYLECTVGRKNGLSVSARKMWQSVCKKVSFNKPVKFCGNIESLEKG